MRTILQNKLPKQLNPRVHKWQFITHFFDWKICHFSLLKLSSQLLAPDILSPKSQVLIWSIVIPHQLTSNSAILQDSGNNTRCCISLDRWIFPPTLFISSSLINGSNFIMPLYEFKHFPFPQELNSFPNVFSGQIWLSTSMPFLLLSNPLVYYNSLRDLFQQMHSVSFLKCKTGPMVLFDLGKLKILPSNPPMMSSCTNAA